MKARANAMTADGLISITVDLNFAEARVLYDVLNTMKVINKFGLSTPAPIRKALNVATNNSTQRPYCYDTLNQVRKARRD